GLLLGGVLKGQELIANAKVKNLKTTVDGVTAAIYGYQDRYRVLPGDDPSASTRFSATDCGGSACSAPSGINAGNGQINGNWNSINNNDESRMIWQHLRAAGFLKGEGNSIFQQPRHPYGGIVGIQAINANNLGYGNTFFLQNIAGKDSQAFDSTVDDGYRNTGAVRGGNETGVGQPYQENGNYTLTTRL
ncbi:MAG: hypothetical protein P3W97_002770, partial [Tepidimonas sp.]|uniref:hypothetical protein n=1 Tax=Tepidimonas sp. TaxID=2002775 RepID=UPI00259D3726